MTWLVDLLSAPSVLGTLRALMVLVGGLIVARLVARTAERAARERLGLHHALLLRRVLFYGIAGVFVASAVHQLGVDLSIVFGAAGVLTVAIGFASQTAASNFVSGLFLVVENPFGVGDLIRVDDTTGEVLSIDWLSVKLRTFDNLLVRIPNETLVKSKLTNLNRFPIRRADLRIGVAYKEDLARVQEVLLDLADRDPLSLEEPAPLIILLGFGESSVDIQLSVWAARENFLALRNGLYEEIKTTFDRLGIEIPFPHRTLYAGAATGPMPVEWATASPPEPPEPRREER